MANPSDKALELPQGVAIHAPVRAGYDTVLTPAALSFVAGLAQAFAPRVGTLLDARRARQARFDAGERPDFLAETQSVRDGDWTIAPVPADLEDRRVEITGPVDRKMVINALNSGAKVFMADFEDATSPTWDNLVSGQVNLRAAVRRDIAFEAPDTGRRYALNEKIATLFVRPRGLHLVERHVTVDGTAIPGSLFDFGLFVFHNAKAQRERGTGPYFYLPKLESHLEARWWNDVFVHTERTLGLPAGAIKATVLIETLPAAFEMDEILYELREHSAGLNCGRWDYIFSFIKKLRNDPTAILPDRAQVTMDKAFLRACSQRLIQTCHRRGAHAMGGMAAQIPIKGDDAANTAAMDKVRADKLREVTDGHDGTWVAHPALVAVAREIFDAHMPAANQLTRRREDVTVTREQMLTLHEGSRTEAGLRHNVRVGIQYIEAWLRGLGCVPLYHLMEDAATAEISRAQVWQWVHYGVALEPSGTAASAALLARVIDEEMPGITRGDEGRFAEARALFEKLSTAPTFEDFLTLPAYEMLRDEAHP